MKIWQTNLYTLSSVLAMMAICVVAQEFRWPSNCGALARVMANFNFDSLFFLRPQCEFKGNEAIKYAKHGKKVLEKASVLKDFSELFKRFDYVVATTAIVGTDYNIPRSPVTPEELAKIVSRADKRKRFAIVIGREGEGMSNEEISKCDFIVTIPTSKRYPTMNVSHAAAIILYELFKHSKARKACSHIRAASGKEKRILLNLIEKSLQKMPFATEQKRNTQRIIWKRLIGKSVLTRREAYGLCGFFKKL